jgi:psp operon transcriptional activator
MAMLDSVSLLAGIDRPVLIVGERGTGKELVAARLHFLSPRWARPFVKLNVAAVPETLLDSELFGHEAGAFTGAVRRREGRFERADGGTLFLDEVATASPSVQEKLLRAVEYGEIDRVGGSTLAVDVRLLAATNADLPALVRAGTFRADLLDRLAFDVVRVPPLRERGDDIDLLAQHFARGMAGELGWPKFRGLGPDFAAGLRRHAWPGNVRELRNAVERSVARWPEPGKPVDALVVDPFGTPELTMPVPVAAPASPAPPLEAALERHERTMIEAALAAARLNRRRAATALGLTYDQLRARLRRLGITGRDA